MADFPDRPFGVAYVIYFTDVVSDHGRLIEQMSPAEHLPAGYRAGHAERVRIAGLFRQTEGDEQYDYGYLADEGPGRQRFLPLADRPDIDADPDGYDTYPGQGQHRKWTATLTHAEWLIFADAYLIETDDNGYPVRYEETLGSITEYGHLDAVAVHNREGWDDHSDNEVIDSQMYISFAYRPSRAERFRALARSFRRAGR